LVTGALVTVLLIGLMAYITYEPPVGGDFHLKYRGEPWDFSADAQPLNVLYIGYAKCPDVCPLTLSFAGRAFRQLSDKELSKVRMLFLSVDYENDNPDDVADYAAQFFPTFVGLSGSENDIRATVSLFQTSFILEKDESSSLGYSIIHPDRVFFLNKRGRVVTSIVSPRTADEILTVIRENL
jgi:protein SCO1/2